MVPKTCSLILVTLLALTMTACGQKGPLRRPDASTLTAAADTGVLTVPPAAGKWRPVAAGESGY